jgi:hypothetical protein
MPVAGPSYKFLRQKLDVKLFPWKEIICKIGPQVCKTVQKKIAKDVVLIFSFTIELNKTTWELEISMRLIRNQNRNHFFYFLLEHAGGLHIIILRRKQNRIHQFWSGVSCCLTKIATVWYACHSQFNELKLTTLCIIERTIDWY